MVSFIFGNEFEKVIDEIPRQFKNNENLIKISYNNSKENIVNLMLGDLCTVKDWEYLLQTPSLFVQNVVTFSSSCTSIKNFCIKEDLFLILKNAFEDLSNNY